MSISPPIAPDESIGDNTMTPEILFYLDSPTAKMPKRANPDAVGMDIYADENWVLLPGERKLIKTNVYMAMPPHYEAQIRARSGLALKHGIMIVNAPGTIDPDYRGEVGVMLYNSGSDSFEIKVGDRIAQMVINRVYRPTAMRVSSHERLGSTERGAGGFGSTGAK